MAVRLAAGASELSAAHCWANDEEACRPLPLGLLGRHQGANAAAAAAAVEQLRRRGLPVSDRAIAAGRCFGLEHQGRWFDVGYPEAIALTEAALAGG